MDFSISFSSKHSSKLLSNKLTFKKHCENDTGILPSKLAIINTKNNKRLSLISLSALIEFILLYLSF